MGGEALEGPDMVRDALQTVSRVMREQAARIDETDSVTAACLMRGSEKICRVLQQLHVT